MRLSLSTRPQEAVLETRENVAIGGDVASAQTDNGRELTVELPVPLCALVNMCVVRNSLPRMSTHLYYGIYALTPSLYLHFVGTIK